MHAPGTPGHSRIMALDVGSKRIGVAVSDPLGITAQGLETIQRQNKRRDLEALGRVLEKYAVREIVVGLARKELNRKRCAVSPTICTLTSA